MTAMLIAQGATGTAPLATAAHALGVDEVQRHREGRARDVVVGLHLGGVLELTVVAGLGDIGRDVGVHAVLDGEKTARRGLQAPLPRLLEKASVDKGFERLVAFHDAVQRVVLDGRELLVVADQGQRRAQPQRRQGLVDTGLVGLVEDDDVEVHVGDG